MDKFQAFVMLFCKVYAYNSHFFFLAKPLTGEFSQEACLNVCVSEQLQEYAEPLMAMEVYWVSVVFVIAVE